MADGQTRSNIKKKRWHSQAPKGQGKRPQGIKKQQAIRKSLRLRAIEQSRKQSLSRSNYIQEIQDPPSPPTSNISEGRKRPQIPHKPSAPSRKRKQGQEEQEAGYSTSQIRDQPLSKQPQTLPLSCSDKVEKVSDINEKTADPLEYWILTTRWPKEYFEQDRQIEEHLEQDRQIKEDLDQDSWLEEQMENSGQVVEYVELNGWRLPRPIKRVPISLRRKQSDTNLTGSDDQTNRENKSAPYRTTRYTTLLEVKGSYMRKSDLGVTKESRDSYLRLLQLEQDVPKDSLFRDDLFERTCDKIGDRNEARVIQDIARLIVPSAETLATYGATHLDHLIEGVNERWTAGIPVEGPRPQPDYSVGFRRSAFTDEQLKKVGPLIGSVFDTSFFMATYRMYFPFFTCEVKCGNAALDVADRQNAHSMTVAVKGVVELFKAVKREQELHQKILAFSISHDHNFVKIYGHYPVIIGDTTTFYRHPIHEFSFTALDGRDKWTAYKFTKNIYNTWMPLHIKRICSAIDDLPPDINFGLSQSASFSQSAPQSSQQSNAESILEDNSQSSILASQEVTPTTSFTQATEPAIKKPRHQCADG